MNLKEVIGTPIKIGNLVVTQLCTSCLMKNPLKVRILSAAADYFIINN